MDTKLKEDFMVLWKRFFGEAELPIAFYYTDEEGRAELVNARAHAPSPTKPSACMQVKS